MDVVGRMILDHEEEQISSGRGLEKKTAWGKEGNFEAHVQGPDFMALSRSKARSSPAMSADRPRCRGESSLVSGLDDQ